MTAMNNPLARAYAALEAAEWARLRHENSMNNWAISGQMTRDNELVEKWKRVIEILEGGPPRKMPCGCCTGGCVCWEHADRSKGIVRKVCAAHHAPECVTCD